MTTSDRLIKHLRCTDDRSRFSRELVIQTLELIKPRK